MKIQFRWRLFSILLFFVLASCSEEEFDEAPPASSPSTSSSSSSNSSSSSSGSQSSSSSSSSSSSGSTSSGSSGSPSSSSSTSSGSSSGNPSPGQCDDLITTGKTEYQSQCAGCHGANAQGGIVGAIDIAQPTFRHSSSNVDLDFIEYTATYMPPGNPCDADCAESIKAYLSSLKNIDWCPNTEANPNEVTVVQPMMRRLNKVEYENTVRDLFGTNLGIDFSFPVDSAAGGFDNNAESLPLTPALMQLYSNYAYEIAETAFDTSPVFSAKITPKDGNIVANPRVSEFPDGSIQIADSEWSYTVSIPENGEYLIELHISGKTAGSAPVPQIDITLDNETLNMGAVVNTSADPSIFRFTRDWSAGDHTIKVRVTNFTNQAQVNISNNLIVHSGSVSTTALSEAPGAVHANCNEQDAQCFQNALVDFAELAYRRHLSTWQENNLRAVYVKLLDDETVMDAFKLGIQAVLMSPNFLYHAVTQADIKDPMQIDSFVLANRLSYFLWSTMPDQDLLDSAASGALIFDAELEKQIDRMLSDPKIEGFIDSFAEQWLALRLFDKAQPNTEIYPAFNEELRKDMRNESRAFFNYFLTNNVPVKSMANPEVAFLSDRLAEHYGMTEPGSNDMTQVDASGDDRRGLFELSAWLIAESEANRTSPIRRANWVLGRFICDPVAPPPPGLSTAFPVVEGEVTMRELMALHRENEQCASCHDKLDPVGLTFENLDGSAQKLPSVDSTGGLPDGTSLNGSREFAQELATRSDVTTCVSQNMMQFALNRSINLEERTLARQIGEAVFNNNESMTQLIKRIVRQDIFRRSPTETDFDQAIEYPEEPDPVDTNIPEDGGNSGQSAASKWTHCADEGFRCNFSGTRRVRFGIEGFYSELLVTDGVNCDNVNFGDPAPGSFKFCELYNEG